ncbi:MAG TPA: DNA topoisomerase III, partial [Candidatus Avibacteroides faecavium]|nr:DNA topoisomerase III [Candidatus Avibacteroides faecavium]
RYAYSADETLKAIQSLYEKKLTTYPRVDTTYLSDDIYPKVPSILDGLKAYAALTDPLKGKKLPKTKKVFDNSKVTDHHAIIPTGVSGQNMTDVEARVYDLVARRFIAAFYPDCKFATTTVNGRVDDNAFKATGKQILDPGWRVVFAKDKEDEKEEDEEKTLPTFTVGESGPHIPQLGERWTQPPKPYTEATLLRAMETAGKLVDSDELREALKDNGIGRPSTRAAIIETLFKRNYVRKERKNLIATPTGIQLIDTIHDELLKSAELTGIWENKLRKIERRQYDTRTFLDELKAMVNSLVISVLSDNTHGRVEVAAAPAPKTKAKSPRKPKPKAKPSAVQEGAVCPLCGQGTVIRGKTALGCSRWREGCTFRQPFADDAAAGNA